MLATVDSILFRFIMKSYRILGKHILSKIDYFLEKVQTAIDPPSSSLVLEFVFADFPRNSLQKFLVCFKEIKQ